MSTSSNKHMIFFTDIDDTLLNTDKSLSDENRRALDRFLEMGNIVCVSTGRALDGAANTLKALGLYGRENLLISSYNGGLIFDTFREETLLKKTIPADLLYRSFDMANSYGIHIQSYTDHEVVSQTDNHHLRKYLSIQKLGVVFTDDIRSFRSDPPPKLLCLDYDDPGRIAEFRKLFEKEMDGLLDCFNSNPWLLEIVPHGVNKGSSLLYLADYYQIPVESTISAGDAENDLTMIRAAGVGCAMKNASDQLKSEADYITEHDNDHAGVAEILEKFSLTSFSLPEPRSAQ